MPFGTITKTTFKKNYDSEKRYVKRMKKLNPREERQVKRIVNRGQEINYLFYNPTSNTFYTTPFINDVTSGISQGFTDNQRVGDELTAISFEFRAHIYLTAVYNEHINFSRIIIFQWKPDSTTTVPTMADILGPGTLGTPNYTSHYNHDKRSLYKIMYDRTFVTVAQDSNNLTNQSAHYVRRTLKVPHKDVQYIAAATTGPYHIYMLLVGSNPTAGEVNMNFTGKFKYRG